MDKIFVIDGNSLINRAFYALPPLAASNGKIYNAVYGFMNILVKLIEENKPAYLAVAFDVGRKTFRHAIYNEYKGTRKGMPSELASQLPVLKSVLQEMNVKMLEQEGVEADDIIGSVCKKWDVPVVIITGDKDCLQLIDDKTTVWLTKHGISEIVEMNLRHLKEEMNLTPSQVIDFKALAGDSSDNIPGVTGIGEKTAMGLLSEYGNLNNIYDNITKITGKTRERLETDKQVAYLSYELATIKTDVTIPCELEDLKYSFPLPLAVYKKFEECEFKSLLRRENLFAGGVVTEKAKVSKVDLIKVENETALADLADLLNESRKFALFFDDDISIAFDAKREYQVKIERDLINPGLNLEKALGALKPALENEKITKTVYCKKDLIQRFERLGINLRGVEFDVSLAVYLVNSNIKTERIDSVYEAFNLPVSARAAGLYIAEDLLKKQLAEKSLSKLYFDLELPLEDVLLDMEREGVTIDVGYAETASKKYEAELKELTKAIYAEAGEVFNLNSPKQLGEILFNKLGLSAANNKKLSTAVDILEGLILAHPIIPLLIRYRKISKLLSTYIAGIKACVDPKTSKVHTRFNQTLTVTGRLSSNEPNLQNIPIRTDEGKDLRRMFVVSKPQNVLLTADYSQIELRLLAHYSNDPNLVKAFKEGQDIHAITAAEIFGVPLSKVTEKQRYNAKAVNFGIIYGISAYGLASNTGIDAKEAKLYIEKYFQTYPTIKTFLDKSVQDAKTKGFVTTLLGRIRNVNEIFSSSRSVANFGERAAMNMPLQGSASDIIKLAMLNTAKELKKQGLDARLILQIHDELMFELPENQLNAAAAIIKAQMENVVKLNVPLTVDMKAGKNWLEMSSN